MKIQDYCSFCPRIDRSKPDFFEEAKSHIRRAAYRIIEAKGSTYYAIAQAAAVIVQAIVRDEKRILPVSTAHPNHLDWPLTAFSVPTILGEGGAEQILDIELSDEERQSLRHSARFVAEKLAGI